MVAVATDERVGTVGPSRFYVAAVTAVSRLMIGYDLVYGLIPERKEYMPLERESTSVREACISSDSQMPRHLISDAHEWINEIPAVPIYYLAKPQPRERAWQN